MRFAIAKSGANSIFRTITAMGVGQLLGVSAAFFE